uniref:Uncharacterized protein n=1 Tax=Leersia perrieri TaxID=77586 RepID=A0A0D9XCV3_9ORYZ
MVVPCHAWAGPNGRAIGPRAIWPSIPPAGHRAKFSTQIDRPPPIVDDDESKMRMIDLLIRVDAICQKYDNTTPTSTATTATISRGSTPPSTTRSTLPSRLGRPRLKSEKAAKEGNRAAAVALNADVRRTKARLLEEVVKLRKLAAKMVKGLSPEEAELRRQAIWSRHCHIGSNQSLKVAAAAAADQNGRGNVRQSNTRDGD